jgi:hypothetical protein
MRTTGLLAIHIAALGVLALVIQVLARRARRGTRWWSAEREMPASQAGANTTTAVPAMRALGGCLETPLAMTGTIRVLIQCPGPQPDTLVTIVARDPSHIRPLTTAIDDFLRGSSEPAAQTPEANRRRVGNGSLEQEPPGT